MAAYQRLNPRLFAVAGLLAMLFVVLIAGLAWRQLLLKPYVIYYNTWLKSDLAKTHPDWSATDLDVAYKKQAMSDYEDLEKHQAERRIIEPGPRGQILDRKGRVLAGNSPHYQVVLYIDELRTEFQNEYSSLEAQVPGSQTLTRQARLDVALRYLNQANALLGRPRMPNAMELSSTDSPEDVARATAFADALEKHHQDNPILPFVLIKDLTPEEYAKFNEQIPVEVVDPKTNVARLFPMQTSVEAQRYYPYGTLAAHDLGYVTLTEEINADDVPGTDLPKSDNFVFRGMEGKDGLELKMDQQLQGKAGGEIWIVDPANARNERVSRKIPTKGDDVLCSIDIDIQAAMEKAMHPKLADGKTSMEHIGSAVALDVRTGEVLAMCSLPSYDLNDTVPRMSQEMADEANTKGGWLNRATQGLYPTGSTFKLITTIAALRAGVLDGNTILNCPSSFPIYGRPFKEDVFPNSWGNIGLVTAIEKSSDVFFYQLGVTLNHISPELISNEAKELGLGEHTGIELAETDSTHMIVPSPEWKKANRHSDGAWNDVDGANLAVGQGYLQVTPLQMACVVASIARNETRTRPTLIHNPNLPPDAVIHNGQPLGLTPEQRQLLLDGMEKVVSKDGTGAMAQIPGLRIAGKTGTAQWGNIKNTTIAWFVCFAPIDDPRIAVVVAIESPEKGSDYYGGQIAAPIAQATLAEYFKHYPVTPATATTDQSKK